MKRNSFFISWLVLIAGLLCSARGGATDVNSAEALRNALGGDNYVSFNENVVTLKTNVTVYETLQIVGGTMVLVVPEGKVLTIDRTGSKEEAKGFYVNGTNVNLVITGGGSVVTRARDGDNGADVSGMKVPSAGGDGYNVRSVIVEKGNVSIHKLSVQAIPGKGGKGGTHTSWPVYSASDGVSGSAWVIDAEGQNTLGDVVPYGAYFSNPSNVKYTEKGEGINQQNATVSLTQYNVSYNPNGGTPQPSNATYTIETANFVLPTVTKNGYTFGGWKYNNNMVDPTVLPTTTERAGNVNMTFDAAWNAIPYKVVYDVAGGVALPDGSYNIETALTTLPTPQREGYVFDGWYRDNQKVTSIPAGTGDVTLVAHWTEISYTLSFKTNNGTSLADISYTKTKPGTLPSGLTKEGYTFGGWFQDENFSGNKLETVPFPAGTAGQTNIPVMIYAKWDPISYAIEYRGLEDGKNPDGTATSYTAETPTFDLPTPVREGYTFVAWKDEKNVVVSSIAKGSYGKKVFTAEWNVKVYTIKFISNYKETVPDMTYSKTSSIIVFPDLKGKNTGYDFGGWYKNQACSGSAMTVVDLTFAEDNTLPVVLYAKWTPTPYTITFNTNGGSDQTALPYTVETETFQLPMKTKRMGYSFAGWYKDAGLTQAYGASVAKGTAGDFTLYAKWTLTEYKIEYDCYHGTNPTDAPVKFTIEDNVVLPVPQRDNFTFVGWHASDMLDDEVQTTIPVGTTGNQKFFAEWTMGNSVQISRPANGTITVKSGSTEVKSGDKVGANTSLTITATPASADYKLLKLVVNNTEYTTTPQTVVMPAEGGLTISAVFTDPRPAASAPKVTTDPVNTDYIPSGEPVTVTMEKSGECDSLLYSIDGATPKRYTGAFQVSTITAATKTVAVQAIARKSGCKDGVTTRNITFRSGKITITFNLPKGITASNPEGGEVVEAVASGGAFEFKLIVDKNYFQTLDSIKVTANGTVITSDIYGIYTLSSQTSDVTVNVSGISGVTHLVTLVQSANGVIAFTGDEDAENSRTVNHGDPVSVTAMADENYKFQSWTDGETANPRTFVAESDVTLQARFVKDSAGFSVILPELEGVTVKPLTGYSTEVKPGGKFKFYLRLEADYNESVPVVYANNEKLNVNQEVYSLYDISENIRISVDGIARNKVKPVLQEHVSAIDVETGSDVFGLSLFTDAMIVLQADAPEGQVFSKWNDGKADNPRIVTAADASQLFPLFLPKTGQDAVCVKLPVLAGAGMGAVNANAAAVAKGESVQLKLVVLPSYSQSDVKVFANGKEQDAALSLRASSETKTLFYTLSDVSEDITVEVSGLKLNEYVVSLEQQEGGTVSASQVGLLKHGTVITLTATPNKGNMFMKWGDGNTLNPYQYVVTDNCTLKGSFAASNMPVGNENVSVPAVCIYVAGGSLHIQSPEVSELSVWSMDGKLIKKAGVPVGYSSYLLPDGMYVVKVGDGESVKIVIR